ncbi:pitrilysin family protein [Acinetobacter sp. YH12095]|uniref:M16 family metallopeptidase n=1 Tax=Acinetobacter sp. YH12095 TaxID=2601084 RepID=UPI0015D1FDFF|nr:pitrilysin family protein [Acinetobacter sp. YH12095]
MKKHLFSTLILSTSFSLCSAGFAMETATTAAHDFAETDVSTPLQSLSLLHSLNAVNELVDVRAPQVHELKNHRNVRTLFVENPALPMVDIQLTFNAGSARDAEIEKGLFGVANMAAQLMDEGTKSYKAEEIAAAFETTGARFSATAYRDMFVVRLRTLSDPQKMQTAVKMMLEILKNSTFERSNIQRMQSNTQIGQKQLQENPSRLMNIRLYRAIYGQHAYAEPITGTNGSIKRIQPTHLQQFRDQFLVAQNMNIAITGKLTLKEAEKLANTISTHIVQGTAATALPRPTPATRFNIQHIPYRSQQAHVSIAQLATTRDDPDYLALEIANKILGGSSFNSILMKELRVKRGYTYGVSSSFRFTQAAGLFSLGYSTRQDQLLDSIQVAHQSLIQFVQQPINLEQLKETKAGLIRAFPNQYSSNASINAQLGHIGFYRLPANYLSDYAERVEKITAEDVQRAVRKHLHPDSLTLVIVSEHLDKAALEKMLQDNLLAPISLTPTPRNMKTTPIDKITLAPRQEVVEPDLAPSDVPASILNNAHNELDVD